MTGRDVTHEAPYEGNGRPILQYVQVEKSFRGTTVLDGISLDVGEGERVCIIGPSGSGKTTLLRLAIALERPSGGTVLVSGRDLFHAAKRGRAIEASERYQREVTRPVGMVFQAFNLFPHMTVRHNLTRAPISVLDLDRAEAEDRARALLKLVGLADKEEAYPQELSGGQQQRVAIARALAMSPKVILFDEVTSALDPELVGEVLAVIRNLAADRALTMVIVTHEMRFAREIADRVVVVDHGKVVEQGAPERIFTCPETDRTRKFLKSVLAV